MFKINWKKEKELPFEFTKVDWFLLQMELKEMFYRMKVREFLEANESKKRNQETFRV